MEDDLTPAETFQIIKEIEALGDITQLAKVANSFRMMFHFTEERCRRLQAEVEMWKNAEKNATEYALQGWQKYSELCTPKLSRNGLKVWNFVKGKSPLPKYDEIEFCAPIARKYIKAALLEIEKQGLLPPRHVKKKGTKSKPSR